MTRNRCLIHVTFRDTRWFLLDLQLRCVRAKYIGDLLWNNDWVQGWGGSLMHNDLDYGQPQPAQLSCPMDREDEIPGFPISSFMTSFRIEDHLEDIPQCDCCVGTYDLKDLHDIVKSTIL